MMMETCIMNYTHYTLQSNNLCKNKSEHEVPVTWKIKPDAINFSAKTMELERAPKRVYINLPKKHMASLSKSYDLEHGLFVTGLNPYLNEGYIQAYFREWGNVTGCKIKKVTDKAMAYVRFASENEADIADWNGPHYIGGTEVIVWRVVCPKVEGEAEDQLATVAVAQPRPRRSMGLGYILEDAQWLDDKQDD